MDAPFGEEFGPHLMGPFAPIFDEAVFDSLPVQGEIPKDLNGVYLRNGPNPRFAPQGRYHPFDGDGMIHAAQFENGRVVVRNKWVRTDAWKKEDAAQATQYWGIMSSMKGRANLPMKDSANTDIVAHGGVALASWYLCGALYRIDPRTLETLGPVPFSAKPGGNVSAHPKVDARTGELMFFDYEATAPYMQYGVLGADGELRHHVPITLPGPRLPHDMAITERYSILHDLPLFQEPEALALGRHKIAFYPELPTRFGVIPRYGASDSIKWFEFSPCFVYHTVNAWEEGDEVVMVGCRFIPKRTASGDIDARATASAIALLHMDARLWCWRMNLRTGATKETQLSDDAFNIEFPTMHGGLRGVKTHFGYLVDHHPTQLRWTGIRKLDTDSGQVLGAFTDGANDAWYSEPWFAPKTGATSEDDGYVISFVWNTAKNEQQLQVFDAKNVSAGPVARVAIPHRVPVGFHGCWVPT